MVWTRTWEDGISKPIRCLFNQLIDTSEFSGKVFSLNLMQWRLSFSILRNQNGDTESANLNGMYQMSNDIINPSSASSSDSTVDINLSQFGSTSPLYNQLAHIKQQPHTPSSSPSILHSQNLMNDMNQLNQQQSHMSNNGLINGSSIQFGQNGFNPSQIKQDSFVSRLANNGSNIDDVNQNEILHQMNDSDVQMHHHHLSDNGGGGQQHQQHLSLAHSHLNPYQLNSNPSAAQLQIQINHHQHQQQNVSLKTLGQQQSTCSNATTLVSNRELLNAADMSTSSSSSSEHSPISTSSSTMSSPTMSSSNKRQKIQSSSSKNDVVPLFEQQRHIGVELTFRIRHACKSIRQRGVSSKVMQRNYKSKTVNLPIRLSKIRSSLALETVSDMLWSSREAMSHSIMFIYLKQVIILRKLKSTSFNSGFFSENSKNFIHFPRRTSSFIFVLFLFLFRLAIVDFPVLKQFRLLLYSICFLIRNLSYLFVLNKIGKKNTSRSFLLALLASS